MEELCYNHPTFHGDAIKIAAAERDISAEAWISPEIYSRAQIHLFANGGRIYGGTPLQRLIRGLAALRRRSPGASYAGIAGRLFLLSVRVSDPSYGGSTKAELINQDVGDLVYRMIVEQWPVIVG